MLGSPWDVVLTIAFAFTLIICGGHFVLHRLAARAMKAPLSDGEVIDINHGIMSVAMIAMIWWTAIDAVTYAQVIFFAVLTLSLLPLFARAKTAGRVDLAGHVALDIAMIWMLAAMPLLMAGAMSMGGDSAHASHHGGGGGEMLMATPLWADVVNVVFIVISAAAAAWWSYRAITVRHHRLHTVCHVVMAAGMAGMLFLMNV